MDIIMLKDVPQVGHKYQVACVKGGYGNYLIKQGYAEVANGANRKKLAENIRQTLHKEQETREQEKSKAQKLQDISLVIPVRADENGKIFGSVTAVQIALALQKEGFHIEPRQIQSKTVYKTTGSYHVEIQLYKDIEAVLHFDIVDSSQEGS